MVEDAQGTASSETPQVKSRPVFLSIICMFSFIYFSLISALFFLTLFFSGTIVRVRHLYIPDDQNNPGTLLFLFLAGFLLHSAAFAGTVFIWHGKKAGYWLLVFPSLVAGLWQLFQPQTAIGTTAVYFILVLLFSLFFKRLH
ncbi:MAG: hypothetical protein WCK34_14340 [Bacteroidota bacterium]